MVWLLSRRTSNQIFEVEGVDLSKLPIRIRQKKREFVRFFCFFLVIFNIKSRKRKFTIAMSDILNRCANLQK